MWSLPAKWSSASPWIESKFKRIIIDDDGDDDDEVFSPCKLFDILVMMGLPFYVKIYQIDFLLFFSSSFFQLVGDLSELRDKKYGDVNGKVTFW